MRNVCPVAFYHKYKRQLISVELYSLFRVKSRIYYMEFISMEYNRGLE